MVRCRRSRERLFYYFNGRHASYQIKASTRRNGFHKKECAVALSFLFWVYNFCRNKYLENLTTVRSCHEKVFLELDIPKIRNSRPEEFCKKRALENFAKLTWKHLCRSLFFIKVCNVIPKEILAQIFYCVFCEISPFLQNTSGRLCVTQSVLLYMYVFFI